MPLLVLATVSTALAQKPGGATPSAGPGPADPGPKVTASQLTICQGGSTVLTATPGNIASTNVTYSWSPNQDLSAATGAEVVVNPLKTTTYTVAINISGAISYRPVTITVNENCCQYSATQQPPKVVELASYYTFDYNYIPYGFGDPFQYDFSTSPPTPRSPGTYFHAAGNLILDGNTFHLPPGGVLLMEAGANVVLQDARLELYGATITAACDEMWGGVLHDEHGHGLYADQVGTLRPRLMHSRRGMEYASDHRPTVVSQNVRLDHVDFLHNYQSLALDYSGGPAGSIEHVRNCLFDSDPNLMKTPYKTAGTNYWYSRSHLGVKGNAGDLDLTNNNLQHAMVGITLLKGTPILHVANDRFANLYLAGIASDGDLVTGPGADLTVATSRFTFPTAAQLPATSQLVQTQADYGVVFNDKETVGISPLLIPATVTTTIFEQIDPQPYATFAYENYRPRQVGINSRSLTQALDNTFLALGVGIAHTLNNNATAEVRGNSFVACEKGYSLQPVSAYSPTQPTGTSYVSCNSFLRGVSASARSGVSYGIYNEQYTNVLLADPQAPVGNPTVLKNLFDTNNAGSSGFYALYNANSSIVLNYYSFSDYSANQLFSLRNNPQVQLTGIGVAPNYVSGGACTGISTNGLPRPTTKGNDDSQSAGQASMQQNVPNPAHGTTVISYRVPVGTRSVQLLMRRAVDGQQKASLPLDVAGTRYELNLAFYAAGTYFYTLLLDGLPTITRRLVVE